MYYDKLMSLFLSPYLMFLIVMLLMITKRRQVRPRIVYYMCLAITSHRCIHLYRWRGLGNQHGEDWWRLWRTLWGVATVL